MKLLMESWRKFINEAEEELESSEQTPEQEEKTEEVLDKIEANENKFLQFFEDNPDVAEKLSTITPEDTETELSEAYGGEDNREYYKKEMERQKADLEKIEKEGPVSDTEVISTLVSLGSGFTAFLTGAGLLTGGGDVDYSPSELATGLIRSLGVLGASLIIGKIAKIARKREHQKKLKQKETNKSSEGLQERKLTSYEKKKKEKIVKGMKSSKKDFEKRYPGRGEEVMYAIASKEAKRKRRKRG